MDNFWGGFLFCRSFSVEKHLTKIKLFPSLVDFIHLKATENRSRVFDQLDARKAFCNLHVANDMYV